MLLRCDGVVSLFYVVGLLLVGLFVYAFVCSVGWLVGCLCVGCVVLSVWRVVVMLFWCVVVVSLCCNVVVLYCCVVVLSMCGVVVLLLLCV